VSRIKKTCIRFPHERLKAMLLGRNSPLRAYGAIFESATGRVIKSTGFGAQKRVSGIKKTCTRFPHERLRATLEGRDSPLRAYEAIFKSATRRVIKRVRIGAQKRT